MLAGQIKLGASRSRALFFLGCRQLSLDCLRRYLDEWLGGVMPVECSVSALTPDWEVNQAFGSIRRADLFHVLCGPGLAARCFVPTAGMMHRDAKDHESLRHEREGSVEVSTPCHGMGVFETGGGNSMVRYVRSTPKISVCRDEARCRSPG